MIDSRPVFPADPFSPPGWPATLQFPSYNAAIYRTNLSGFFLTSRLCVVHVWVREHVHPYAAAVLAAGLHSESGNVGNRESGMGRLVGVSEVVGADDNAHEER